MSKIVVTQVVDVEEMLVRDLRSYFTTDVRFSDLFPNFGGLNVTQTHPFAVLMSQEIDSGVVPTSMFPCIAVTDGNSSKNPQGMTFMDVSGLYIGADAVTDFTANRELFIISDADLATLGTLTQNAGTVNGQVTTTQIRSNLALEVWADNDKVKSRIFYLLWAYFASTRRIELFNTKGVHIVEETLSAEKSGVYNMDFGMMLCGSMVRLSVDYELKSYVFDTDLGKVGSIYHTVEEVHDHG